MTQPHAGRAKLHAARGRRGGIEVIHVRKMNSCSRRRRPSRPASIFLLFIIFISLMVTLPTTNARGRNNLHNPSPRKQLDDRLALAERLPRVVRVRQDGTGDFRTVTEAVASIPSRNTQRKVVEIGPGVYREKVTVPRDKPFVTFSGADKPGAAPPTITYDGTAAQYGTVRSATVAVDSDYFVARGVIFENSAPKPVLGVEGAQAVALRISGNKAAFLNCTFRGYQDTLCDDRGMHLFQNCLIIGTEDFIFGNGRSLYWNCTIQSVAPQGTGSTAITAQGRSSETEDTGFSFVYCTVTGTGNAYLSRAWRSYSRVVFAYTYMDAVVHPKGWDDKGNASSDRTVFYGEYHCTGPGARTERRVSFTKLLTERQALPFLTRSFVQGESWLGPLSL